MGYCSREAMNVPRGERYELCRSVHAEANAIISASRRDMVGGTIYLVGRNAATGELLNDATSCLMCRRMVINAGLERVVIRRTETEFEVVPVEAWIAEDDLLTPENVVMERKGSCFVESGTYHILPYSSLWRSVSGGSHGTGRGTLRLGLRDRGLFR